MAVLKAKQVFLGTVYRSPDPCGFKSTYSKFAGQPLPQILGEVCHLEEGADVSMVYPPHDLTGPIGFDIVALEPVSESFLAEVAYIRYDRHMGKGTVYQGLKRKYFLDICNDGK
jgi:hypothetical protein